MKTLLVLMTGLALGVNGTDRFTLETEQLGIKGYWEGIEQAESATGQTVRTVKLEPGRFNEHSCRWIDEGQGKCRFIIAGVLIRQGIYKRDRGQVIICYSPHGEARPTRFQAYGNWFLLILKPVNPPRK